MNLIVGSPVWLTVPLLLLLFAAAVEDAVRLKISNVTCGLVFVGAVVAMVVHGFSVSLWQNTAGCLAIITLGTPLFAAGWLGGGDVKLLAALGLWLNLQAALGLIAAVFIAGGLLAIISIAGRRAGLWRRHSNPRTAKIPYGVAIAAGAFFIFGVQINERVSKPFNVRMNALQVRQP